MSRLRLPVLACSVVYTLCFHGAIGQTDDLKGWHLLDMKDDGYHGISLKKALHHLASKKPAPVVVAVIDSGIDTTHEALKPVIWMNKKETPNGIDDDGNGYPDDTHGWNFLGSRSGNNVEKESSEAARLYHRLSPMFEGKTIDTTKLTEPEKDQYKLWQQVSKAVEVNEEDKYLLKIVGAAHKALVKYDSVLRIHMKTDQYTAAEVEQFVPADTEGRKCKLSYLRMCNLLQMEPEKTNLEFLTEMEEFIQAKEDLVYLKEKQVIDHRKEITLDDSDNWHTRNFGNADVMGASSLHGTHVAGIIGAVQPAGEPAKGIAPVKGIMAIRVVPKGDEHDKDVALGIRYAVDNGARVINMSFGKSVSPQKKWVDEAIRYAASKGVLLVRAAGNDGKNLEEGDQYPSSHFANGQKIPNLITVGASSDPKFDKGLIADFSNYGKSIVDVFAPGVKVYSTIPTGNRYGFLQGTSMAAPVVSGIATLLFAYYPQLSAEEVKQIIENSVDRSAAHQACRKPGALKDEKITLDEACRTGGVVNAYSAVLMAEKMVARQP